MAGRLHEPAGRLHEPARRRLREHAQRSARWSQTAPASTLAAACLLLFLVSPAVGDTEYISPVHDLKSEPFQKAYQKLEKICIDNEPRLEFRKSQENFFLGPRRGPVRHTMPKRMINFKLLGRGEDEVTMHIADDDLYHLGYSKKVQTYHLKGWGELFTNYDPPAIELPFDERYKSILSTLGSGGHRELVKLALSRRSALDAVSVLSNYDPATTPLEDLQVAYAKLTLMFPESVRLNPIRDAVAAGWDAEEDNYITDKEAKYVVNWAPLSHYLYRWNEGEKWPYGQANEGRKYKHVRKQTDVETPEEALKIVHLMLRDPVGFEEKEVGGRRGGKGKEE